MKVFVDTAPVMEKPLAEAAGLGWQGKHTNLVSREFGSWLFLGSIFTTAELEPDAAEDDHCGSCRACLDICPTDAFPAPYRLDARRCISYLTIENKGPIPREFRAAIGNRIYGCDDCLAVCPWNKFAAVASEAKLIARDELRAPPLAELLALDDAGFRALFAGSPVKRIGRDRFLRNVLIAAGNSGDAALADRLPPAARRSVAAGARRGGLGAVAAAAGRRLRRAGHASVLPGSRTSEVRAEWRAATGAAGCGSRSGRMSRRFFIFGAGYSGRAFARLARREAFVAGTTRSPEKFERLRAAGIEPYQFDGETHFGCGPRRRWPTTTHLIVSTAPGEAGDPVLAAGRDMLASDMPAAALDRLSLDRRRLWRPWRRLGRRDERMPAGVAPLAAARRGRTGLAGASGAKPGCRSPCCRLSGIYGPGRNAFVNLANGTARRLVKPGQVFNRIHVADIAGALRHLARHADRRHLQRHRRPAGAAAGCRRLCREIDGDRAAARNSVRDRPTFAHGAVLLRREQARFERLDQGGGLFASRFPTTARRSIACGPTAIGAATATADAASPINPS